MKKFKDLLFSQTSRDTLISLVGLAGTAGIGFIYTIVLARYLEPTSFGIYSAITAMASIVYSIGDFGFTSAIINFLPKSKEKKQVVINTGFTFQFIVGLFLLALFFIASYFHDFIIPGSVQYHLILAGILTLNYLLFNLLQSVFNAERRFWRISLGQILDSGIKITIVFILLSTTRLSISTAIIANIISSVLALLITSFKHLARIQPKIDRSMFSTMAIYSRWIGFSRLFNVLVSRIDVLLINYFLNSFQAGIFSAANRVTMVFSLLVSSLNTVVNPRFSAFDTKEKIRSYIKKLYILIIPFAVLMFLMGVFSGPLITFVYGEKYLQAIPVFQALTLSMIPYLFSIIVTPPMLYSYGQSSTFAIVSSVRIVLMIIVEIILLPRFGVYSPAIANGITNAAATLFLGIKLHYLLRHDPPKVSAS